MQRSDDLSRPRGHRGNRAFYDPDAFGRFSEGAARFLGTGRFLAIQSIIVFAWIILNGFLWYRLFKGHPPDQYPFILLNLIFSTQAAYAAPLILLAQNRQSDRDRAEVERDRESAARARADMDFVARELAATRLALMQKADREDLMAAVERIVDALESQGIQAHPTHRSVPLEEPAR